MVYYMKNYIDNRITKASNTVAKTSERIITIYERRVENRDKILEAEQLYLLKGRSYIEEPNSYHKKIVNLFIHHLDLSLEPLSARDGERELS